MIKYNIYLFLKEITSKYLFIMYIFKTYFSKYIYTYNIAYVCVCIVLNI
jgi:hypothetical protein